MSRAAAREVGRARGKRLVVWRHGRTAWNLEGRFQGQSDIPLDEVGRQQAATAAAVLAAYQPAALVSSDLSRASQTADALAAVTGLSPVSDPDLREVDVGSWAGLLVSEVRASSPLYAQVSAGDVGVRRGGDGESLHELADRVEKGLRRSLDAVPEDGTVVVACHGLATRVGIAQLLGLPPEHWNVLGTLRNCSWVVAGHRGELGWRLEEWGATARA